MGLGLFLLEFQPSVAVDTVVGVPLHDAVVVSTRGPPGRAPSQTASREQPAGTCAPRRAAVGAGSAGPLVYAQAPIAAYAFRAEVTKWLVLVRLLLSDMPERTELTAPGLATALRPYFHLTAAVRAGDLATFGCGAHAMAVPCMFHQMPSKHLCVVAVRLPDHQHTKTSVWLQSQHASLPARQVGPASPGPRAFKGLSARTRQGPHRVYVLIPRAPDP